ncbi:MAG TPA: phosphotransferase family protein [Spongiibacteraceae bacterium]|nr:phosphotransferase family protein [Spongiibacteraceae bacterium]
MAAHVIDARKLATYLECHIDGFKGPLTVEQFAGGQSNPTYKLRAASGTYVLRSKPLGVLLKSAHAVDREFRVVKALADSEVPVATAYHLCSDDSVIGSMFYVMSFAAGRNFWDAALPELTREQRPAIYDTINNTLAALHNIDIQAVGLGDFGKPGNYFERQIGRWQQQYRAAETETIPSMEELMAWLPANLPADDGRVSLIHGDFRIDNMIFDPQQPRVIALLDWELATLGHPLADLAYYCMWLRLPKLGAVKGLAGEDIVALNIPSEQKFVEDYCRRTGITRIDNWNFYLAFSFFKMTAIVQGILKRALEGNASNSSALEVGRMAGSLSTMAMALLERDK